MHPEVEDVAFDSTAQIVSKIRCEARQGILEYALLPQAKFALEKKANEMGRHVHELPVHELTELSRSYSSDLWRRTVAILSARARENARKSVVSDAENKYQAQLTKVNALRPKAQGWDPNRSVAMTPEGGGAPIAGRGAPPAGGGVPPEGGGAPPTEGAAPPAEAGAPPAGEVPSTGGAVPPARGGVPPAAGRSAAGGAPPPGGGEGKKPLDPKQAAKDLADAEKVLFQLDADRRLTALRRTSVALNMLRTHPEAALLNDNFVLTAIGYDFRFTISEDNNASGDATFTMPFSNGTFTLALSGGENKQRKAERSFDLAEFFVELLLDETLVSCSNSANWRYPMDGQVGVVKVAKAYTDLSLLGRRFYRTVPGAGGAARRGGGTQESSGRASSGSERDRSSDSPSNTSEFSEVLTYTTTISGSANPRIRLSPVTDKLRLTDASLDVGGERKDEHKVTIGFSSVFLDPEVPDDQVGVRLQSAALVPRSGISLDSRGSVLQFLRSRRTENLLGKLENLP